MRLQVTHKSHEAYPESQHSWGILLLLILLLGGQFLQAQTTWDGSDSNDWFNAANWSAGVPDAADGVTIPNLAIGSDPINLSGTVALAKSVTINTSTALTTNEPTATLSTPGVWTACNAGTITGTTTVCASATTQLSSNGDTGGIWSSNTPAAATVNPTSGLVSGVNGGTSVISYTVTDGVCTSTTTALVTVNAAPNAAIAITENNVSANPFTGQAYHNISYTDGILCTGPGFPNPTTSATLTASGGGTYLWSNSSTNNSITVSTAGTYTVVVTNAGCQSTVTKTIAVNSAPNAGTITATPSVPSFHGKGVCFGSTITLSSTVPGGEWSMFTGFPVVSVNSVTGLVTPIVNTNSTDTSSVRYLVTAQGCASSVFTRVEVLNSPNAGTISGNTTLCFNTFGTATTQLSTNGTSGGTWASSNPSIAVSSSGLVSTNGPGTTTISYTVTSGGCTSSTATLVTWNALPNRLMTTPAFGTICQGASFSLSVPDAGTGTSYNWSGDGVVNTNSNSTTALPTSAGFKTYTVTITPSNGCGAIGYGNVDVGALPNVTITATPNPVCLGLTLDLSVPSAASTTYAWTGPGLNSTTGNSVTATPPTAGMQTYMVTATTSAFLGNCVATGMVDVNVTNCCPAPGAIWYVNAAAAPGGNGASWECAFQDLQSALAAASSGHQIWVAAGTYKPTSGVDRTISFLMKNGMEVLGGFPNTGDPGLGDRDWVAHVTTLSGEIGAAGISDNSYHVVFFDHVSNSTLLDGFTITGSNGGTTQNGGGIYNDGSGVGRQSNPRITHCTITGNVARNGGGLFNDGFRGNSSPEVTDCVFSGNKATRDGGAVYNFGGNNGNSSPVFTNVVFLGNKAERIGGGVFNDAVDVIGGVSNPEFVNCSFSGNQADFGVGGMYNDAYTGTCLPTITNCILWGNAGQIDNRNATPTVAYSIVQGGHTGTGNLDFDPLFVAQPSVGLGTAGDLHLQICSPAIDAGNDTDAPATDLNQNARFDALAGGSISDMGAFEFQSAATPTVAICQTSVNAILDNTGHATILATALNNGSTGCSPLVFSIAGQSSSVFDCSQVGNQTVTLTATYVNRTGTCTSTVQVIDNAPPTITCPANIAKTTDAGQCSAVTNYTVTASDNCTYTLTRTSPAGTASGSSFPLGMTNVAWSVTDAGGNSTACTFTVTISDATAPTVICKNFTTNLNAAGAASITTSNVFQGGSDNCGTVNPVSVLPNAFTCANLGTNSVVLTVNDGNSNTATCSATVTIVDATAPTVICKNFTTNLNAAGAASITTGNVFQSGSDNCGTVNQVGVTPNTFTCANLGANTVVLTVNDGNSNTATCSATVTIVDAIAPTVICKNFTTNLNTAGAASITTANVFQSGSDNCGTVNQVSVLPNAFTCANLGTNTVVLTVRDGSSNTATCSAIVTVADATAPTIICPANIVRANDLNQCSASVAYATPTASDNCGGAVASHFSGGVSGAVFQRGTTTVIWRATDGAGLTGSCSFTITVNDTQKPNITCPANQTRSTDLGLCSAVVTYPTPKGTDNCGLSSGQPVWISGGTNAAGSTATFQRGATTVIWRATDGAGNTQTCSFRVTVNDTEAPTLTCPAAINITTTPNLCSAVATYTNPTFTDNCAPTTGTAVRITGLVSGSTFPVGNSNVVFQATDAAGNTRRCTMVVTVTDNQPPVVTCPPSIIVTGSGTPCMSTVFFANATATDNCAGTLTPFLFTGLASGSAFPAGITTNTFRAVAPNGQSAECSFTVAVNCGSGMSNAGLEDRDKNLEAQITLTQKMNLGLTIAPNPASASVTMNMEGVGTNGGTLLVFDQIGRLVQQQVIAADQRASTLQVAEFAPGLYRIILRTDHGIVTKTLVVIKE